MKCHGSDSEIYDEVTRVNRILSNLNTLNESTITRWTCVFDPDGNRILFISNQYIYAPGNYSLYGGLDFETDLNVSGALLEEYTREFAVFDIVSNLTGNIGNEFRIKFDKTQKGDFMRVYQLANHLESVEVYDADRKLEQLVDSEFISIIQYENSDYPDIINIFSENYFKDKKFMLNGGVDKESFTFDDMGNKLKEYHEIEDDILIDAIFDCMVPHLDFHKRAIEAINSFNNIHAFIITNGDLFSGENGYNPYIDQHKFVFYNNVPITLSDLSTVSLGAIIIDRIYKYDYIPDIRAILSEDYLNKIKLTSGTDVITPEIDHQIVYLNELKIAGLDLEDSIDQYLLSFLKNELKTLFNENFVGHQYSTKEEMLDDAVKILEHSSVAPNLILSYYIDELSKNESTVFLSLRVYREEISGGIRNLYININL
jgi:hypothetical protein